MASFNIKNIIEKYFQTNFTTYTIQYEGMKIDTIPSGGMISLIYSPIENSLYGIDGTSTGRIEYAGMYKIFCYASNPTKAYIIADAVKTFLNGKQIGDIYIEVGQDNQANDLNNGFYELLVTFNLSQWS